jgi:hypothetical protein
MHRLTHSGTGHWAKVTCVHPTRGRQPAKRVFPPQQRERQNGGKWRESGWKVRAIHKMLRLMRP